MRTARTPSAIANSRNGASSGLARRSSPTSARSGCACSARHANWSGFPVSASKSWNTWTKREWRAMSRDNAAAANLRSPPGARYAVIASRWNSGIVDALVEGAQREFGQRGVPESQVEILHVPGAWELPVLAAQLAVTKKYSAIDRKSVV